jgi:HEPN domain-containing protein
MLNKNDLEKLAQVRLDDAILLHQAGRSSSAYYLAGYALELSLKACISKLFQPNVIPDKAFVDAIYTHKLDNLMSTAGLSLKFKADCAADHLLAAYWGVASQWRETSRYELWDSMSTGALLQAIHEPKSGVFQWVKQHW